MNGDHDNLVDDHVDHDDRDHDDYNHNHDHDVNRDGGRD